MVAMGIETIGSMNVLVLVVCDCRGCHVIFMSSDMMLFRTRHSSSIDGRMEE
jgi:hypothetical protein